MGFNDMSGTERTDVADSVQPSNTDHELQARQINRFQKASEAFIAASIHNRSDAQQVWDKVVMKWLTGGLRNYDKERPFRPFLKTVLKNEIRRFFRDSAKRKEYENLDETTVTEQVNTGEKAFDGEFGKLTLREALESVRCDIDELSKAHQFVVESVREKGKEPTSEEIALELGITREAARAQKSRSQRKIREQVIRTVSKELQTRRHQKIEEELAAQGLLVFCEHELSRMCECWQLIESISEELKTRSYQKITKQLVARGKFSLCKDELSKMREAGEFED